MHELSASRHRRFVICAVAVPVTIGAALAAEAQVLEEITVTGSRVRGTSGMAAPVPVTSLTTDELATFEPVATIAEQLDALPQFFQTFTAQRGHFPLSHQASAGYLDMRRLGPQRTLVLLDGSRVVPGDKRGPVNVEDFPTGLIRSVDVVTGGASAQYGADALGGVVNFVLDREYEGLDIKTGVGKTAFGDGDRWNFSLTGGHQFGEKLNLIGSLETKHIDQIWRNPEDLDQSWFKRWGWVTNPDWSPGAPPGVPQRLTLPWVVRIESPYGLIRNSGVPELDFHRFTPDGSDIQPFIFGDVASYDEPGTTNSMSGGPEAEIGNLAYNSPINGNEVDQRSAFVGLQYQFNDRFTGFGQIMIGETDSRQANIRGLAHFPNPFYATISIDNAYLPANVRQIMMDNGLSDFRMYKTGAFLGNLEIGQNEVELSEWRTTSWSLGFDYSINDNWQMRATWQTGESKKVAGEYPMMRVDRIFLGLDAVEVYPDMRDVDGDGVIDLINEADRGTGTIVCNVQRYNPTPEELAASPAVEGRISSRSPNANASEFADVAPDAIPLKSPIGLDNTVQDCVPYNVMGNGNMSQEALDYTATPKVNHSTLNQDFAELTVTGDLAEGWGAGPIALATGLTWREQDLFVNITPEEIDELGPALNDPNLGIRNIPPGFTGGSPYLWVFSTAPLISGKYDVWEWFGELNVPIWRADSGRQRLGSDFAYRTSDYSGSGQIDSWKIGLDYQVTESFRLRGTKSRDVREPTFSERYDAQGGGATITDPVLNNSIYTITTVTGGNDQLNPELADTTVLGFVYEPQLVEGLQLSADWYEVDLAGKIDRLSAQRVLDECVGGSMLFCNDIRRQPDGTIGRIQVIYQNIAQAKAKGVDFEIQWRTDLDFFSNRAEAFSLRVLGGYLTERSDTPLGGTTRDIAGEVGTPKLTGVITANYSVGPFDFQLQGRYIDETLRDIDWVEGVDVDDNTVSSSTWWNGRISYTREMSAGANWDVSLNIQNLLDEDPPIIASLSGRATATGGSQTVNDTYDIYGRRYALNFNYNF